MMRFIEAPVERVGGLLEAAMGTVAWPLNPVVAPELQAKYAESIPLPVMKKRHSPTTSLETSGENEGF